jgi:hypothetical protein
MPGIAGVVPWPTHARWIIDRPIPAASWIIDRAIPAASWIIDRAILAASWIIDRAILAAWAGVLAGHRVARYCVL